MKFILVILGFLGIGNMRAVELNYDHAILLDAEDLAEGGINKAIETIQADLNRAKIPVKLSAVKETHGEIGSIEYKNKTIVFFDSEKENNDHLWALATYALFFVVNDQLEDSGYKLYAVNGGNDLVGFLLRDNEYRAAIKVTDVDNRPYLPSDKPPMFGYPEP
jgi:hypothetical protein